MASRAQIPRPPIPEWLARDYLDPVPFEQRLEEIHRLEYGVSLPDYHWSPEAGFKGLGDVKAIRLSANRSGNTLELFVKFALRASQCQKVLDDKAKSAF